MIRFYWPQDASMAVIEQLQRHSTLPPFSESAIQFVQGLSQRLVRMREYPEVVALGFWLRKANMKQLEAAWRKEADGRLMHARGTVFHIAPSNVDTIFVYSWILSILAGNRNLIRVSGKNHAQINVLLAAIIEELFHSPVQEIADRTVIMTYAYDDEITAKLSKACHTRVIWGGDVTVNTIRSIPLAPLANELAFPNRFSMSVFKTRAVNELHDEAGEKLAEQFYNDTFWFDQMACSSPRLIMWEGDYETVERAQERFWAWVFKVVTKKQYAFVPAVQVQKLAASLQLAADERVTRIQAQSGISRVQLGEITDAIRERHCGGGLFYETVISDLDGLTSLVRDHDQSLTYFGYTREDIIAMAEQLQSRGIDRIVPVGKALDFQAVWDGQSFLRSFTREIVIL